MADRIPISNATDAALKAAVIICAVDRDVPSFYIRLWALSRVPLMPYGGRAHQSIFIHLEINSKDDTNLQKALSMVKRAKGRLPKAVQHLKK